MTAKTLAGERIEAMLTTAPGNGAAIGGLKVVTANGWFAARPSGTEDVYKLYAESFLGADHLRRIQEEARALIARVFSSPGGGSVSATGRTVQGDSAGRRGSAKAMRRSPLSHGVLAIRRLRWIR